MSTKPTWDEDLSNVLSRVTLFAGGCCLVTVAVLINRDGGERITVESAKVTFSFDRNAVEVLGMFSENLDFENCC